MTASRAPYALVTAFTTNPFGGNPAAVVFLDTAAVSNDDLGKIAANLNQPVLSVLTPEPLPSSEERVLVYNVRFILTSGREIPLCGHGTMAASKALFALPEVQAKGTHTVHFKTISGATLKAVELADGFIEIELPVADIQSASPEVQTTVKSHLDKAFGRDVRVKDIKVGTGSTYDAYVLVELDVGENLGGSTLDGEQLRGNGFRVNVITTQSPTPDVAFVSRMFAPTAVEGTGEDHVCGSAHGLLVPFWSSKLGIAPGEEIKAKQVSARGGDLRVVWEKEAGTFRLRGQCVTLASGELHI
ncbi:hypothetical protein HYPSUDRAFT_53038 [Hypholoma sublateritium FD-334 SS-4]|uniref:Diaminopimelate epimerase-like protein n=1 Tax=Hypholoma sublateritium (strain FD-334 SS-4) TaxID=945553 RepID=A0A0D2LDI4_HYPSF|nr:hypothetical protein HYPSUDRAFT_53038 [Hypholoma sublateritium FD-334 SS-4]